MKRLITISPENLSESDAEGFEERIAARAVIFDNEKNIALVKVGRDHYYKLPGGGIDEGETIEGGLAREIKEETGCTVEVGEALGDVIEYRGEWKQTQQSYAFLAQVVGEKDTPQFTDFEKEQDFEMLWVPLEEALELVRSSTPANYLGQLVVPRDTAILEEAQKNISG